MFENLYVISYVKLNYVSKEKKSNLSISLVKEISAVSWTHKLRPAPGIRILWTFSHFTFSPSIPTPTEPHLNLYAHFHRKNVDRSIKSLGCFSVNNHQTPCLQFRKLSYSHPLYPQFHQYESKKKLHCNNVFLFRQKPSRSLRKRFTHHPQQAWWL